MYRYMPVKPIKQTMNNLLTYPGGITESISTPFCLSPAMKSRQSDCMCVNEIATSSK